MASTPLSGCAIINDGHLLLIWKKKQDHYEFPGGKVELGETLEQTALRETREEIGIDASIVKYWGHIDFHIGGKNFRSHIYLAKILRGQTPLIMEPELFRDIFWLPMKEYARHSVAPNVQDFCKNYILGN